MSNDLYLTDKQYYDLLIRVRKKLEEIPSIDGFDCTITGNKDTQVNVGLCSDEWTTKDNAMWPNDFPHRRSMKYRKYEHRCPLDWRPVSNLPRSGCFYTCRFFKRGMRDVRKAIVLYDREIERVEKLMEKPKVIVKKRKED